MRLVVLWLQMFRFSVDILLDKWFSKSRISLRVSSMFKELYLGYEHSK